MDGRLAGKVGLVTGAGRGQGRSHAVRFAEEGADVIAIDICRQVDSVQHDMPGPADLEETRRQIEASGGRAFAAQVDVRDLSALTAAVTEGVRLLGRLDIVVANAGIFSQAPVQDMSEQVWQDMIDINLTGVWHTVKSTVPTLIDQNEGGSIIIISSAVGLKAIANAAHYVAAKHGLVGLTQALALELAPHKIRVNSVHPTTVSTKMTLNDATYRLMRPDLENPRADDAAEVFQSLNVLPVPWVESADISNGVVFLASDEARFVTGIALPIDAGYSIK